MTRDEWDNRAFEIGVIKTLMSAYRAEHDWDADEDSLATHEMLEDAERLHDPLMTDLGDPPDPPAVARVDDPEMPF